MRSSNTSPSWNQALANNQQLAKQLASEQGAYLQQLHQTFAPHGLGQFYPPNPAPPPDDDEVAWLKRRVEEVMFR